jgi:hypothetical protein
VALAEALVETPTAGYSGFHDLGPYIGAKLVRWASLQQEPLGT